MHWLYTNKRHSVQKCVTFTTHAHTHTLQGVALNMKTYYTIWQVIHW